MKSTYNHFFRILSNLNSFIIVSLQSSLGKEANPITRAVILLILAIVVVVLCCLILPFLLSAV